MYDLIRSLILEQDKEPDGTYVGAKPSKESKKKLKEAAEKMGVPNLIPTDKMHITLIYSRKYLPEFEAQGTLEEPINVKPKKLEIFPNSDGEEKVLVIRLDAPELVKRHKQIMKEHKATYDFDEYKPHLTLSYDCNGFDVNSHDISELPETIEIVEEYGEELNLNWAKS